MKASYSHVNIKQRNLFFQSKTNGDYSCYFRTSHHPIKKLLLSKYAWYLHVSKDSKLTWRLSFLFLYMKLPFFPLALNIFLLSITVLSIQWQRGTTKKNQTKPKKKFPRRDSSCHSKKKKISKQSNKIVLIFEGCSGQMYKWHNVIIKVNLSLGTFVFFSPD